MTETNIVKVMSSVNIQIQTNVCWVCGTNKYQMTIHHAFPQYLKPKSNICLPVCKKCHERINNHDVGAMFAYAFKLEKIGEETRIGANKLRKMVEEFIEYRRNKNVK